MSLYQERSVVNNGIKIVVTGFNHVIILNAPRFYSLDNWPVYWLIILIKFVSTSNSFGSFTSASQLTCLQALEGDVYGCLHASVCLFVCSYTRVTRLLLYHLTSILPQGLTVAQSICHFLRKCLSVCLSVDLSCQQTFRLLLMRRSFGNPYLLLVNIPLIHKQQY